MAKRKLSKQQRFRIQRIQQERVERANKREEAAEKQLEMDELGPEQKGVVISHFGVTLEVETQQGQRVRCNRRASLPALVTGDVVIWRQSLKTPETGVIVALNDRNSVLNRPDMRGKLKPVAANIDQILIVIAPAPLTPVNLIDRYLVAAHISGIQPVLVLNKSDLLENDSQLSAYLQEYKQLGYECLNCSAETEQGLEPLRELMSGRTSVFVGQSGVGKSSLINQLIPDVRAKTNIISESTGKGKHTTTTAVLYHVPGNDGALIDSPGIREFGLWHVEEADLFAAYPEFSRVAACKFRDCKHESEPGCGIQSGVAENAILERRYLSYLTIRDSLDEVEVHDTGL